ncbi:hypothetical protein AJ79_02070 [Helicocarpus griseus UAMH5409]|uniref:Uncharacterized protein n=1 Tax=Helicocarpus griseus UAMH5409 TaxID=1447875 RepID=A0A2B7Y4E9_9EURO|nr:hypothetical protein AJ79_02070 [Helicocarpus griseus UAMH5409]
MHVILILASLCLIGLSRAQETSVTQLKLPRPMVFQTIVASVVEVDAAATIFALDCPKRSDSTECLVTGLSFTDSPNEIKGGITTSDKEGMLSYHLGCKIQTALADCSNIHYRSMTGTGWVTLGETRSRLPVDEFIGTAVVTITAGLEKLKESPKATTPTIPVPTTGAAPTTTDAAATSTATTKVSSGGAAIPMITAAANWGIIGSAAVAAAGLVV